MTKPNAKISREYNWNALDVVKSHTKINDEFHSSFIQAENRIEAASIKFKEIASKVHDVIDRAVSIARTESDFSNYKDLCNIYTYWLDITHFLKSEEQLPDFPTYNPSRQGFLKQYANRIYEGVALADTKDKTAKIFYEERVKDAKTGKILKFSKKILVHDENEVVKAGDWVIAGETRKLSKRKHAKLLFVEDAKGPR